MVTATSGELRQKLHDFLSRAEYSGERVIVTRHGKPVAAIVSIEDYELLRAVEDHLDGEEAMEALREAEELGFIPWEQVKAAEID